MLSLPPPPPTGVLSASGTLQWVGLWLGSLVPLGEMPRVGPQAPLPAPPPPLGDGARGPRMQTKGVTDQEIHLEKWKIFSSIEPVGDTQLIGISGFL